MGQANPASKVQTRYYPPEMLPLIYCFACIQVVLTEDDQAEEVFQRIIESYRFPDVKMGFEILTANIPEGYDLLNTVMQNSNIDSANCHALPALAMTVAEIIEPGVPDALQSPGIKS
ncbi:hypothetical protein DEALK_10960 [Dehalogenimonas alkenigignens]|uniref:Uncharacterized protein n=1 Tax=Dehalogenimonas alkenigignens TaxID=1217799 RepID=A0A0W0GI56_9CHLR|nr:hypothetical protein [Dehalogenimonas alkenigignens]KTB48251.1 hypothetical protein DEALK_10960 [Dehalogenimonas alkenigignens]